MSIGNARPLDSIIKMRLCSRINKPFIMNSSIMFFTKILYPIQRKPYTYKYIFKKKLFSFIFPNEVRNALLAKKKQFIFYKLIFNKSLTQTAAGFYSTRKLKKIFNYHSTKLMNNKQMSMFQTKTFFSKALGSNANQNLHPNFRDVIQDLSEVSSTDSFGLRGDNNSFRLSEVKIPRIQFKPGYQRM
jgi:hypothetical protein